MALKSVKPDYRLNTDSTAVFGRLTFEPIDGVRLVAGARQTWEEDLHGRAPDHHADLHSRSDRDLPDGSADIV